MKKPLLNKIIIALLFYCTIISCTEQYVLQTNTFENVLVVEATLTNEFKKQEIKISRTYRFEDKGPTFESGADVTITDNTGNVYVFKELSGIYVSESEFQAIPGRAYRLNITTNDKKSYTSTPETLTPENQIESVTTRVETKNGQKGVQISVNSTKSNTKAEYYKYDYDETFKIITPYWNRHKAVLLPLKPWEIKDREEINLVLKEGDEINTKICYSTNHSSEVAITNTKGLSEDRIVNFPIRYIAENNYIVTNRYSIIIRQYVLNLAAYTFYKTLDDLSGSKSILSPNQPGFIQGNIKSTDNPNEKVIGFFNVSSASSKRIFINPKELFSRPPFILGDPLPPYYCDCPIRGLDSNYFGDGVQGDPLRPARAGFILRHYFRTNEQLYHFFNLNIYYTVPAACGDCTTFSSNIKPTFWED